MSVRFMRWAVAFGVLFGMAPPLQAADALRSAAEPDYPPLSIVNAQGQADGFAVEMLRSVLREMDRDVTFEIGPWDTIRKDLADGKLDVLPLVGRTPEREALYDFTIPYLTLHGALFIRHDNADIQTWADAKGKRIAVMKGDNAEEYARRVGLTDRLLTPVSFSEAFRMLSAGDADAVIAQKLMGISLLKQLGIVNVRVVGKPNEEFTQAFCFAVQDGQKELLALLNEGLSLVMARGLNRQLEEKWMGAAARDTALARVLVYGGNHAFPPYEFLDEKGQPAGLNIDLARAVAKKIGTEISFQLGPWEEVRKKIENREIDLACMFYSLPRAQHVEFSIPHTSVFHAIFARDDSPPYRRPDDLKGKRIAVQRGDIMHDYALEHGAGDNLTVTDSSEETLRQLALGHVDYAMGDHQQGLYWIQKNHWPSLCAMESHLLGTEYCFVVPKGNTELRDLLNSGLRQIEVSGEYRQIYNTWLGVVAQEFSWKKFGKTILFLLGAIAGLAALAGVSIYVLHRQVEKRTAQLEATNAALEKSNVNAQQLMREALLDKEHLQRTQTERERLHAEANRSRLALLSILDDEKRAEAERTRLSTAIEQAAEIILITDATGCIQYVNPAFTAVSGYSREDALGQNPRFLQSGKQNAAFYRAMWAKLAHGEIWRGRMINKRKDGHLYENEATISPVHNSEGTIVSYVAVNRDVTREVELEAQMVHAQKMESVGRLAGGVAHDFNNLLMGIMGYVELCQDKLAADHPIREWLDEIMHTAQRSAEITKQLLAFARKQPVAPKVLNLNEAVAGLLKMLQRLCGEDIQLAWMPGAKVYAIRMDPSQLDQILVNLCVNARDAIADVGKITLEAGNVVFDAAYCAHHIDTHPGAYACLSVSDNGRGMGAETLDHLFEPFFTTKEVGKGTGLGLATVYGIVKQNQGFIYVYSEEGKGSTFKIYLPRVHELVEESTEVEVEPPHGHGETILLVEDEKSLRVTCCHFLEAFGYRVLLADSPESALKFAEDPSQTIALLLTDVVMPGMNGRQLAEQVVALVPNAKVLFMSGYTADVMADRGVLELHMNFIGKPFARNELAHKVHQVLQ